MRILFYIEPRIEMGMPYMREWWLNPFSFDLINALRRSARAGEFEFCIAMNEALAYKYPDIHGVKRKVFTQRELKPPGYRESAVAMSVEWLNGTYSPDLMSYYERLMSGKLSDFVPDIIVTFTAAPFFRKIFPRALVLHHEVSLFSRAPYPQTWHLDPAGLMFSNGSFLNRFRDEIGSTALSEEQASLVRSFRERCRNFFLETSPFDDIMLPLKERFEHIAFVPLGHSECCSFYSGRDYTVKSQYEFLENILDNVPESIGVIATTHPDFHHILPEEARKFLMKKYPHYIYNEAFEKYYASSQYLLAYADVIIGIYSSLCFQAVVLDKRVINIGSLHVIADSSELQDIEKVCMNAPRDKDSILYWILTRYSVQKKYLYDPEWLAGFMSRSLERFRGSGLRADFFDEVDSAETIFTSLAGGLDLRGPAPHGRLPYDVLKRSYDELKNRLDALGTEHEKYRSGEFFPILDMMVKEGEDLFQNGRTEEAEKIFSELLGRLNKYKGELINNLAVVNAGAGRLDVAELFLQTIVNEGYEVEGAQQNLEMIRRYRQADRG